MTTYWSNLYSSEGPHQSAYIMIKYLSLQLKGWTAEQYRNFFISYDNMCAIDGLNLLKKPLPLPAPEDRLWLNTRHLIDDLHLRNHKRQSCHERYNPEILKQHVPDANLICCEETFAWQSRFRRILCTGPEG